MKEIFTYSNIGDSLSAIQYNFACLDIKLSNIQSFLNTKLNKVNLSEIWNDGYVETLALSSNWESVKEMVHNTSAYWNDNRATVVYETPFPQGTASESTIKAWATDNFVVSSYPNEFKLNIVYFVLHKNPALHRPPNRSQKRFGRLSSKNNVHIQQIKNLVLIKRNGRWNISDDSSFHEDKPCLFQYGCEIGWGRAFYAQTPECIPQPIYYQLSCVSEEEPPVDPDPCTLLNTVTATWDYPDFESLLLENTLYQYTSATDFSPYILDFYNAYNPSLELVGGDNVYQKYVNNSSIPLISNKYLVDRQEGFNTQHTYSYDSSINSYSLISLLSSYDLDFSGVSSINFPIGFKHHEITQYIKGQGLSRIINQASMDCSFDIVIQTTWYRWVTDNLSLSSTPYWHIGTEVGSALGFDHDPQAGFPDPPENWASAYTTLSGNLLAYFGTYEDMMGLVKSVEIV